MIEYVKKDDILEHFCEYCDSHVVGCNECPIKAAIAEIPVVTIPDNVKVLYVCDTEKNTECSKTGCWKNGGDCFLTKDIKFAAIDMSERKGE